MYLRFHKIYNFVALSTAGLFFFLVLSWHSDGKGRERLSLLGNGWESRLDLIGCQQLYPLLLCVISANIKPSENGKEQFSSIMNTIFAL